MGCWKNNVAFTAIWPNYAMEIGKHQLKWWKEIKKKKLYQGKNVEKINSWKALQNCIVVHTIRTKSSSRFADEFILKICFAYKVLGEHKIFTDTWETISIAMNQ